MVCIWWAGANFFYDTGSVKECIADASRDMLQTQESPDIISLHFFLFFLIVKEEGGTI